jgi:hypothetical protein
MKRTDPRALFADRGSDQRIVELHDALADELTDLRAQMERDRRASASAVALAALDRRVERLTVMVQTLTEALGEKGVIDAPHASARVEQRMLERYPPSPAATLGGDLRTDPYRGQVAGSGGVVCDGCGDEVDPKRTRVVAEETLCERCAAEAERR